MIVKTLLLLSNAYTGKDGKHTMATSKCILHTLARARTRNMHTTIFLTEKKGYLLIFSILYYYIPIKHPVPITDDALSHTAV